jgi:integrase
MTSLKQTGESKKPGNRKARKGSIIQRSKGAYQIRYNVYDDQGQRKQVNETFRGTKDDAENLLALRQQKVREGQFAAKSKATLSDLMERFLNEYCVPPKVRARTRHGYEGQISRYINKSVANGFPAIGRTHFQKLKPVQIKKLYANLLERGLSNTTVLHLHRLLKKAFNWAVSEGLHSQNPLANVDAPTPEEAEMDMWEIETIHDFIDLCAEDGYGDVFRFAIHTGLRRSEILGLRWDAVDLTAGRLRVFRTLLHINGQGVVVGEPKTKKSRRTIALAPETVNLLHSIRGTQMDSGLPTSGEGYVFTRLDGLPLVPSSVSNAFHELVLRHNLPKMKFHGLRHAYASLSLLAGIDSKVVSESLGHSTISITMDLYSHVMGGMKEAHAATIANLLKREVQPT